MEVDLRLTLDGRLLLQHDADFRRCCGDGRRVRELDSRERAGLNCCFRRPELAPEAPLLLDELLELAPPEGWLFLELKEGPEQVGPLLRALAARPRPVVLISFHWRTLRELRRRDPHIPLLWLRQLGQAPTPRTLSRWLRDVRQAGFQGLDLDQRCLTPEVCRSVREAGLELGAWTVDEAERARDLAAWGVDWLTSNRVRL